MSRHTHHERGKLSPENTHGTSCKILHSKLVLAGLCCLCEAQGLRVGIERVVDDFIIEDFWNISGAFHEPFS